MNDEEQAKHRSTKDRKAWCKGKEGVYHQTALVPVYSSISISKGPNLARTLAERCVNCGKNIYFYWRPYDNSRRADKAWKEWDEAWIQYSKQERDASRR